MNRASTCSPSTITTRSTASASSPARKGCTDDLRPRPAAGHARRHRRTGVPSRASGTRRASTVRVSGAVELFRRAASARLDSASHRSTAGMCCSTRRRSRRPIGSTSAGGVPISSSQSFYKIFGYPTGVGCLMARKAALAKLHRPWFAGGTITVASVQGDRYYLAEGEAGFEDGTPNYLSLPAVEFGLQYISSRSASTRFTIACAASPAGCIEQLDRARARQRDAPGAHLRTALRQTQGRHRDVQSVRPRGTRHRPSRRRAAGECRKHLIAHRLLL